MKKCVFFVSVLSTCVLLSSCGQDGARQESDTLESAQGNYQSELETDLPECGELPEFGADMPKCGEPSEPETGTAKAEDLSGENPIEDEADLKEKEGAEGSEEQVDALLSDKLLKVGETMEILYPVNDNTLEQGLEITLKEAKLYQSPEEAKLDRALMEKETENYDLSGNPVFCSIDEARILTCNLTIKNVNVEQGEDLHIGEIMIAYVEPTTQKVSIISCMPVYFSASSSTVGASDYYHYAIPKGESKDMTVAWLIPEEYEAENLYLGVTYDVREPKERQYFRLLGQE